jgi:hypothetical protein
MPGMELQQEQAGDGENDARDREHIDEPEPGVAAVPAFVEIVEIGDPAAIGVFRGDGAGRAIDADPGIAPRAGQRDIDFFFGPLARLAMRIERDARLDLVGHGIR